MIAIDDVKRSVFLAMLEYIYTDHADIAEDDAVELLTLANEYSLDRLKSQCEHFIEQGLDVENAAWLLGIQFQLVLVYQYLSVFNSLFT